MSDSVNSSWRVSGGANVALQSVVMSFLQLPKLFASLSISLAPFAGQMIVVCPPPHRLLNTPR